MAQIDQACKLEWLDYSKFESENKSNCSEVFEVKGVDRWGRSYTGPAYHDTYHSKWIALEDRLVNRRVWISKIRRYEETNTQMKG